MMFASMIFHQSCLMALMLVELAHQKKVEPSGQQLNLAHLFMPGQLTRTLTCCPHKQVRPCSSNCVGFFMLLVQEFQHESQTQLGLAHSFLIEPNTLASYRTVFGHLLVACMLALMLNWSSDTFFSPDLCKKHLLMSSSFVSVGSLPCP